MTTASSPRTRPQRSPTCWSAARQVGFERESSTPFEVVALNYDSYANLVALGGIPQPYRGGGQPEPFPIGFVPDPR